VRALTLGAATDDRLELAVKSNFKLVLLLESGKRLTQASTHAEIPWGQDHAGIGTPPQNGLAVTEPGKNACPVGFYQSRGAQVSACGEEAW